MIWTLQQTIDGSTLPNSTTATTGNVPGLSDSFQGTTYNIWYVQSGIIIGDRSAYGFDAQSTPFVLSYPNAHPTQNQQFTIRVAAGHTSQDIVVVFRRNDNDYSFGYQASTYIIAYVTLTSQEVFVYNTKAGIGNTGTGNSPSLGMSNSVAYDLTINVSGPANNTVFGLSASDTNGNPLNFNAGSNLWTLNLGSNNLCASGYAGISAQSSQVYFQRIQYYDSVVGPLAHVSSSSRLDTVAAAGSLSGLSHPFVSVGGLIGLTSGVVITPTGGNA